MIRNTPLSYEGIIDLKPLFIEAYSETKTFDIYYILKNSFWFNEIIKAGFINNDNFNGKITPLKIIFHSCVVVVCYGVLLII